MSASQLAKCPMLRPRDGVRGVPEVARRLLAAYTVEGGGVHLGGCLLEACPFVRLMFAGENAFYELFIDEQGAILSDARIGELRLLNAVEHELPPRTSEQMIGRLIGQAEQAAWNSRLPGTRPAASSSFPAAGSHAPAAIVWAKFATGKLIFSIGELTAELPFAGWADALQPQPFVCPASGLETFHLAATDDGRIVAAQAIALCTETGKRLANSDLARCAITGVTLQRTFTVDGIWTALERLQPIGALDPRLARLLAAHPELRGWRNWRIHFGATAALAESSSLLRSQRIVFDSKTGEILFHAQRLPFGKWKASGGAKR